MVTEYYAVISDIHGNLTALKKMISLIREKKVKGFILLGDIIDYGPRSNEVIEYINVLRNEYQIVTNIWGNHERAVLEKEYDSFSSERGVKSAKYTGMKLNDSSIDYLMNMDKNGFCEFAIEDKKCLAVHGSLEDVFWKSIEPDNVRGIYEKYDYVFSGHSHIPHYFSKYWKTDNPETRNKKKTIFLNPGSVGQPRDLNNRLSFALIDVISEECQIIRDEYDIKIEQSYFESSIDEFYCKRLERGV